MPCLIPEILFAIRNKLVEDGDSDAVYKFALSGKEFLKAMKNVFTSVKHLELCVDQFVVGWNDQCSTFELKDDKLYGKFLLDQIGSCVETLHLNINGDNPIYEKVLDNIIVSEKLLTLYIGSQSSRLFIDKFLPAVSTSLKNVTIPSSMMNEMFRDSLVLDSLIVLDPNGWQFLSFCCKTESLEFSFSHSSGTSFITQFLPKFDYLSLKFDSISPHLSTVKKLTFNETDSFFNSFLFDKIMDHFPALEVVEYNQEKKTMKNAYFSTEEQIFHDVIHFFNIIKQEIRLPQKFQCKFYKCDEDVEFPSFDACQDFFDITGFYDETNQKFNDDEMKDFHCFRLNIPYVFDESRTTIFEIQIAK